MPIKPLNRNNVSEQIFEQMLGLIAKGEWKPGEKIPSEAELKDQFSVSRISVREALQKMSALGLTKSKPGLGTYISEVSPGLYIQNLLPVFLLDKPDILQVMEFRKAVEVVSAKLAATSATDEEIASLAEILDNIKKSENDFENYLNYDIQFHSLIFQMTKNTLFIKVRLLLDRIFQDVFFEQTASAKHFDYEQHRRIFVAIENHDPEEAYLAMEDHINHTIKRFAK